MNERRLNPGLEQRPGHVACEAVLGSGLIELYEQNGQAAQDSLEVSCDGTPIALPSNELAAELFISMRAEAEERLAATDPWERLKTEAMNANFAATRRRLPEALNEEGRLRNNMLGWVAVADDEHLAAFLRWNEWSLRPAQTALRERIKHMQGFMVQDVERLIAEDALPPHTRLMLEDALNDTDVRIIDSYEVPLCIAYCKSRDNVIGVHERTVTGSDVRLYLFVVHEFFHQLAAERGGEDFRLLFGKEEADAARWFNEAVNDQLAMAAVYGNLETIDPDERWVLCSGYRPLLELLHLIIKEGDDSMTMREVAHAYIDPSPDKQLRQSMLQKIEDRWRPYFPDLDCHIVLQIAREYNGAASPEEQDAVVAQWLAALREAVGIHTLDLTEDEFPRTDPAGIITMPESALK